MEDNGPTLDAPIPIEFVGVEEGLAVIHALNGMVVYKLSAEEVTECIRKIRNVINLVQKAMFFAEEASDQYALVELSMKWLQHHRVYLNASIALDQDGRR